MIQQHLFVCGNGLLSHPVSFLFHLDSSVAKGTPDKAAIGKRLLVIADCRTATATDVAGWVDSSLAADKPVLLLCPSVETLAALKGRVGILPETAVAALFLRGRRNASGLVSYRVHALEYAAISEGSDTAQADSAAAAQGQAPKTDDTAVECACIDFVSLGSALVGPAAADQFKVYVEREIDPKNVATPDDNTPPTGLKHFMHVLSSTTPFTYSGGGVSNKSAGAMTRTWTVWGFLGQSEQGNSQYLVVESRISTNAGSLYANDARDRGFGNSYVQGTLTAPMSAYAFVPTSGDGTFSGTVSIPISYNSPTGGYQLWTYTGSVNNTVSSWACKSISSDASLGAQWWMTSPCDGSNIPDKWEDAYDSFWGHVNDFTGASSGSLDVNTISAWVSNTVLSGSQTVNSKYEWQGVRFWSSECNWLWCGIMHKPSLNSWSVSLSCSVDFTPIIPS